MSDIVKAPSLPERMEYAKALATASLLPDAYRGKPGNVLLAVEYGHALGVPPMTAIQGIHVIKGKPTLSADLMAALVRRSGHRLRVHVEDGPVAVAELIRSDDADYTYTCRWDIDRARQADLLGKDNWEHHPAAMLKARAISEVVREGASEVLHGMIYTPEELGAVVDGEGDVIDGEIVEDGDSPEDPEVIRLNHAKRVVATAWEQHYSEFDPKLAAQHFGAWSGGEVLADAPVDRLEEYAAWLAANKPEVEVGVVASEPDAEQPKLPEEGDAS